MYRPEIKRKRSGAPVLSRKEIDVIGQNIVGDFMPEALKSPQEIDIDLLAQDYLGLDNRYRMNTPSTVGTNWKWRIRKNQLSVRLQKEIHGIALRYGRMNWIEDEEEAVTVTGK